jgi:protocatechuate 3,4-dioxygenase beta subunit
MTTHESIPEGQRSVRVQHVYLSRAATTDHRGEFRFVGLRPGRYSLGAESSYFGHAPQRQEVEAPASRPVWADVNLTATAWVRGVVRDSDGRPVPGAVVRVTGADGRPPAGRAPDLSNARDEAGGVLGTSRKDDLRLRLNAGNMALTDDQGRFGFFGLAAGPWTVTTRVGESEAVVEGQEPGGPDVVLVVQADSVLAGVVRDAETGRPVEQFDLRLLRGSQDKVTPYDRVSAERAFPLRPGGEWRVLNATGSVLLRASAPGYAPATLKLDDLAAGQRRDNLEIRLLPLCSLTLNLSFEGARLEFEPVMLMFERGLVYESTTDAAGRARPGQVMPARYEVRAVLRDGTRLAATVDVPARAAATLEVALIRSTEK